MDGPSTSISVSPTAFNVNGFGAVGDGQTNCTKAFQSAIDEIKRTGGGTLHVPPGQYVIGSLFLTSTLNLQLDPGATLLGSQLEDDFPLQRSDWEGPNAAIRRAPLLAGENLNNVSITGRGKIDARGKMWWEKQLAKRGTEVLRPLLFRLVKSSNLLLEGVTLKNSPMWTVSPLACDNITVRNITIQNPADSPNTDGINPESCRNVRIEGCHIDVGDDCITIKSGKEDDHRRELPPCENITVTGCTLLHGHGGVVIGSEMSGSVRNVVVSNCVFIGTDRGLRFKSRRGRAGVVEDFRADNLIMDGVICPIAINLFYAPGARGEKKIADTSAWPVDETTPRFRRLRFSNITAKKIKAAAVYIQGLPEMPVEDIAIDNTAFHLDPDNTTPAEPDMAPVIHPQLAAGIIAQQTNRLALRNVDLHHPHGPAIMLRGAKDTLISGLRIRHTEQMITKLDADPESEVTVRD